MEAGRMVVVDGVAEFVEDDEVAQMFGQRHQVQAQRQVVAPVAGAPFGAGGPDRHRTVLQTGSHCEFRYAGGKYSHRFAPQLFPPAAFFFGRKDGMWRLLGEPFGYSIPGRLNPSDAAFQKFQSLGGRDAVRVGEPDGAGRPYAE